MAGLVTMGIIDTQYLAVRARWNDGLRTALFNRAHQRIGIVALIGRDALSATDFFQQRLRNVGLLRAGYRERDRVAKGVRNAMHFTAEAAARAAQRLCTVFFWAPAAC